MASAAESILGPIRDAAHRAGIAEFWHWWVSELAAMVPAAWRERLSSRGITLVAWKGDGWRALRSAGGQLVETGQIQFGALDIAGRRQMFRRLEREVGGGAANVWLVLPDEEVLVRAAVLPLAAEEALRDALGFELDRLTPFPEEQVCYDHRVTGRDPGTQRINVEVVISPRAAVEARLSELREFGATVLGVGVASDLVASATPFNLLAPQERDRPSRSRAAVAARLLAAVASVLALTALVYPVWQKHQVILQLQPRLETAKASAAVADRLAREIEKLAVEHNFLLSRKQGHYPAVVLLEDLSRLLTDTTWVQQLEIKSSPKLREIQISGETGSSSQLIELLEKSGSLVNASFKSPVTKGVTPNTERFLVAAEVKTRPLPDPIPEAELLTKYRTTRPDSSASAAPASTAPAGLGASRPGQDLQTPPPASGQSPAPAVPGIPANGKPASPSSAASRPAQEAAPQPPAQAPTTPASPTAPPPTSPHPAAPPGARPRPLS